MWRSSSKVFQRLVDEGNGLIVIEHNLEVIKSADWLVDLGPEAGDQGEALLVATRHSWDRCDKSSRHPEDSSP